MGYRTKTYIAADWTGDKDAVDILYKWNENEKWGLSFSDAHEVTQANDNSLKCSIKASLKTRMDVSKTFVLIVGSGTKTLTNGSCRYCNSYNSYTKSCSRGHSVDYRSFIEYECDMAIKAGIKIVVLYNSIKADKSRCIDAVKNIGVHAPMQKYKDGKYYWDYQSVKDAMDS